MKNLQIIIVSFSLFSISWAQSFSNWTEPYQVDQHTIALWHFDESAGDTLFDSGPNAYHGLNFNTVSSSSIPNFGGAREFNNNPIGVISFDNLNFPQNEGTIEYWIKPLPRNISNVDHSHLFVKGINGNGASSFTFYNRIYDNGAIDFGTGATGGNTGRKFDYPITFNAWQHIAFTWGTDGVKLYINGNLYDSSSAFPVGIGQTSQEVALGRFGSLLYPESRFIGLIDELRISDIERQFQAFPQNGYAKGVVSSSKGLQNVTVELLDQNGIPLVGISDQYTNANGEFSFADIPSGEYQVMVVEPLGYIVDQNPKVITVESNETTYVNFSLEEVITTNSCRSKGYWKHQFDAYVSNKGKAQETEQNLYSYIDLVDQHYSSHYGIFSSTITFEDWQDVLSMKGKSPMVERAKQHLAALIMNMVSGKVGQYTVVTEDGMDVGDVVQYASELIIDGVETNDELAKDLAEKVNNQQLISSGLVPNGSILFKHIAHAEQILTYQLSNNYPNPFNPSTTIKYSIPKTSIVTIKVYDILGREVQTLVNQEKAPGNYEVNFNAESANGSLTSGLYFYRIKAGDYVETRKMTLLK